MLLQICRRNLIEAKQLRHDSASSGITTPLPQFGVERMPPVLSTPLPSAPISLLPAGITSSLGAVIAGNIPFYCDFTYLRVLDKAFSKSYIATLLPFGNQKRHASAPTRRRNVPRGHS